ncbi:hypothetical protein CLAVI_001008 [Candidatus Clavichlamydia salmonicola]|uniref:hypothetical protein n=1 Tax=Candidatus Clavichlamydia salmonicola TaxID=469812 RepID=UPI001891F188|nr:hypothetical protein [Candidatus Clavichlamydia salmonicola]MBF5051365.1 hypothetical protein [Candidatus Clavichlamydia salmonicola]
MHGGSESSSVKIEEEDWLPIFEGLNEQEELSMHQECLEALKDQRNNYDGFYRRQLQIVSTEIKEPSKKKDYYFV